ncbi:tetratricopeptide repeat protein [Myxococcaceae bacterium GXIMD 01537]
MKVSCPSCQTTYNIDDKRIPPGGAKLKCARCQNTFPIKADTASAPAAIPLPPAPAPQAAAIPLPPAPAPQAAIPLPGAPTQSMAIPLPAASAPVDPYSDYDDGELPGRNDADSTRVVAIPLPNAAYREGTEDANYMGTARDFDFAGDDASAIPLPPAPAQEYDFGAPPASDAIPLPPAVGQDFDFSAAPASDAIPLPPAPAEDFDFGAPPASGAIPLPPAPDYGYDAAPGAIPLPAAPAQDFDFGGPVSDAIPLPGGYEAAPPADEFDFGAPPEPPAPAIALPPIPGGEDPFAFDAAPPPAPAAMDDAFALPPPPMPGEPDLYGQDPVSDPYAADPAMDDAFALPPPPAPAPAELDFADLPSPAASPPPEPDFSLDFGEPPPPAPAPMAMAPPEADPFALDFAEPPPAAPAPMAMAPPPANPMMDFGDVDFGEPPPSAAPVMGGPGAFDSLEFDPTAAPPPSMDGMDDLEADLSSPLPPPSNSGSADGLEMLSFIDDAAKDGGAGKASAAPKARRFHVRRRSGKVFGPFDEGVIVKMLEDGQLLGNEDVSPDSENWVPIGTVGTFASAIQQLMEGPSKVAPPSVQAAAPEQALADSGNNAQASMDRLKQLYEGRMAAVAVVDRSADTARMRKRMPLLIGGGALLLVLGTGFSFNFTRYGAFGINKFMPARVAAGSPAAADVDNARKALLQDTFRSYQQARELTAKVLRGKEYPEVRALWCQSVYYLQRRYAVSEASDLSRCQQAREQLELLGEKNLEALKYAAGAALTAGSVDSVIPLLRDARSRDANAGDVELAFLLAEAYADKHQEKEAIDTLTKVLAAHSESAKAHHALGDLHQAAGRADEAAQAYEAALKADPNHLVSAVELAAVELLLRKNVDKGAQAVERALDEKLQAEMGPAELARALSLKGVALTQQFKLKEAEEVLRAAIAKDDRSIFTKAQLARVLRAQRKFDDALPLYQAAVEKAPDSLEYTDGYITMLVMTGKMSDALKAVEAANNRFANEARIAYLFGRIDDARDELASAEGHYKRAIAADPKLFEANLFLGRFYLRLRRTAEAREQLEQAAAKAEENAGVRAGLGELALAENNLQRASDEFERAARLDPNLADAHLGLSRVALLEGNLEVAKTESNKALELDPHMLKDGRLQRGTVFWRLGQLDEAIAELEKAKEEDPRSVNIPITLGAVLFEKGDLSGAEKNLLLALDREPSNHEAFFNLARVRHKRAEYTQAIDTMKSAAERAPKRPDYRYFLGVIYRDAKRAPEAIEQWKVAVELDPTNADAHEALGQALLDRGDIDEAIKSFDAARAADPKRTRVLGAIGDAYFTAQRWDEAISRYQQALKEDPKLTYVYYKVGRSYTEKNLHPKAVEWYRKATVEDPENAMPWYYLGFAYKEQKAKRKEAIQAFKNYLQRKPEAEDRREIEDEIYDLEH